VLEERGHRVDADRLAHRGAIVARVWADTDKLHDRFANLRRLGIDEIAYKRGHRYITVVVDHDSGRLVWAAPGRDKATLRRFFDALEASGEGAARPSPRCPPTPGTGSPPWSPNAARARSAVPIRFTS
jgi:transposase